MLTRRCNILTGSPDLPPAAGVQAWDIRLATEAWELRGYAELRRRTFCAEQRLFDGSDHDAHDVVATPIVAVSSAAVCDDEVIGCVRIFPTGVEGEWFGSRLSVARDWRGCGPLAAGLIRAAVTTAIARGGVRFRATVQRQNVPLFRRLHWRVLEIVEVRDTPHALMEADLSWYSSSSQYNNVDASETGGIA